VQERGQWFESKYARYAIAALHPAFILRQDAAAFKVSREQLIADLQLAKNKAKELRDAAKSSAPAAHEQGPVVVQPDLFS
jgi:DNA polymerase